MNACRSSRHSVSTWKGERPSPALAFVDPGRMTTPRAHTAPAQQRQQTGWCRQPGPLLPPPCPGVQLSTLPRATPDKRAWLLSSKVARSSVWQVIPVKDKFPELVFTGVQTEQDWLGDQAVVLSHQPATGKTCVLENQFKGNQAPRNMRPCQSFVESKALTKVRHKETDGE